MTDITELALLISKAKASVFTLEYISQFEPADIDSDDVDLRLEVDGRDTGTNVSIVDECGQAAKVIGALVEALESEKRIFATWRKTAEANSEKLEKAQQQMTESENRVRKQNRHICELFDDNTALRQRIAELESRLESADKLQDSAFRSGLQHGFSLGQTDDQKGYEQSMAAYSPDAAIKWESA